MENKKFGKQSFSFENPPVITEFDYSIFSSTVEKIIVSNNDSVTFVLKGGLHLEIKLAEVR